MRTMSRCVEFSTAVVDSTVRELIEELHPDIMVDSVDEDQQEERDQHVNHQPGGPLFTAGFDPIEASFHMNFML